MQLCIPKVVIQILIGRVTFYLICGKLAKVTSANFALGQRYANLHTLQFCLCNGIDIVCIFFALVIQ